MWLSILPEHLSTLEVWVVRFFLFLGLVTMGPWLILLLYDFLLYCWRSATYEVPVVGGRARGRQRPRAPSLNERPNGIRRTFSIGGSPLPYPNSDSESTPSGISYEKQLSVDAKQRHAATFEDD